MSYTTQILHHLQKGRKLTALEALNRFGYFRLSARIHELKEAGYPIKAEPFTVRSACGKSATVARYSLKGGRCK